MTATEPSTNGNHLPDWAKGLLHVFRNAERIGPRLFKNCSGCGKFSHILLIGEDGIPEEEEHVCGCGSKFNYKTGKTSPPRVSIASANPGGQSAPILSIPFKELQTSFPAMKPPVIHGIVRREEVCNIIAPPKVGKSWLAYDMALSIVTGTEWLDAFQCVQGKVLLIDNELHPETISHRIPVVAKELDIPVEHYEGDIDVVSLRGRLTDYNGLGWLAVKPKDYQAIIIDAHYRMIPPGTSENANAEMAAIYNLLDQYTAKTKAAWILIHHSSKGSQADKSVTDVGAGAGSQARAADTHLILRPHEEPGHVVLEAALRSFPPVEPIALKWEFPLWTRADVDPTKLAGRLNSQQQRWREMDVQGLEAIKTALAKRPHTIRSLRATCDMSAARAEKLVYKLVEDKTVVEYTVKKGGNECSEFRLTEGGGRQPIDHPSAHPAEGGVDGSLKRPVHPPPSAKEKSGRKEKLSTTPPEAE